MRVEPLRARELFSQTPCLSRGVAAPLNSRREPGELNAKCAVQACASRGAAEPRHTPPHDRVAATRLLEKSLPAPFPTAYAVG